MLNVGLIGAGDYGEQHAQAIDSVADVRLVAACRTNPAALSAFVGRYGGTPYTDYRDLLAEPAVDAVVIATPHDLHVSVAEAAAAAGKHILLEKPMAPTLAECDQIIGAAERASVKLMVGHVNHFTPASQLAKQLLESGEMGEVVSGVSTLSKYWMTGNRRPWHLDRTTGGGVWLTVGLHAVDRLTWLVGSPVERVTAQLGVRLHDQQADDTGVVFLRYASGAAGVVVSTGYATGAPKNNVELTCTHGMLNIDHIYGVRVGRDDDWQDIPNTGYRDWMQRALVAEWEAFAACVGSAGPSPVSGAFARHIMAVMFAAEESAARRCEIDIPR